jgi:hypothetical protein
VVHAEGADFSSGDKPSTAPWTLAPGSGTGTRRSAHRSGSTCRRRSRF